jgi:hypothetical protein
VLKAKLRESGVHIHRLELPDDVPMRVESSRAEAAYRLPDHHIPTVGLLRHVLDAARHDRWRKESRCG